MEKNIQKRNNHVVILTIVCIVLIIALVGSTIWYLKPSSNSSNSNRETITLKHTNSVNKKSEGVYITDVSDVVDEVMPSIVAITSKTVISSGNFGPSFFGNGSYTTTGAGSGVIVAEDSNNIYILTNYHVVENSTELSVKFIDDNSYDASIKGVSKNEDVAIVTVSTSNISKETLESIKIATLGNSDELKVGNGIIAIGNALGYGQSVTTGVVSALNREVKSEGTTQIMIQIDAAINGGNSGGALLNSKGEVVGINSAKYSSNAYSSSASIEGMGFAIPISDVESIISDLINGSYEENNLTIGIEGYMTNSNALAGYQLPVGFYIAAITKGGNAENSDLEIGNIITEIDGNSLTSFNEFSKVLSKKKKGDKVTLKVKYASKNEYKEKTVTITLNK